MLIFRNSTNQRCSRSKNAYRQQSGSHNPYFVVCERRDGMENSVQHVLEPTMIDQMSNEGLFSMDRIKITLSGRQAETEMFFCLGDQPKATVLYPISGFPRSLIEELNKGPKVQRSRSSHVAKTSQYKLDWADFERKRAAWTFAAARYLDMQNPFQHYASSEYVNPGNAATSFLDSLKTRFESDPSLPRPNSDDLPSANAGGRSFPWRSKSKLGLKSAESHWSTADTVVAHSYSEERYEMSNDSMIAAKEVKLVAGMHEMSNVEKKKDVAGSVQLGQPPSSQLDTGKVFEIDSSPNQSRLTAVQMVAQHMENTARLEGMQKSRDASAFRGLRNTAEAKASLATMTFPYHPPYQPAPTVASGPISNTRKSNYNLDATETPISAMTATSPSAAYEGPVSAMSSMSPGAAYEGPVSAMSSTTTTPYGRPVSPMSSMSTRPNFSRQLASHDHRLGSHLSANPSRPPTRPDPAPSPKVANFPRMPFDSPPSKPKIPDSPPPDYSSDPEFRPTHDSKEDEKSFEQRAKEAVKDEAFPHRNQSVLNRKFSWESIASNAAAPATSTPGAISSLAPSPPISRASSPYSERPMSIAISEDMPIPPPPPMGKAPPVPKKPSHMSVGKQATVEDESDDGGEEGEDTLKEEEAKKLQEQLNAEAETADSTQTATPDQNNTEESKDMYSGDDDKENDEREAVADAASVAEAYVDAAAVNKDSKDDVGSPPTEDMTATMRIKKSMMSLKRNPSWLSRSR